MNSQVNIDEIDAKILTTLLRESRTTFTEIARECKISVAAVRMRYKHLWKTGIINGDIMLVNPRSLGYEYVSVIGVITAIENAEKTAEFLKSKLSIPSLMRPFGKYSVSVQLPFRNMEELSKVQRDLEANPLVKSVDVMLWTDSIIVEYPENLMIKPLIHRMDHQPMPIKESETLIDETDRKIAKILSHKSRTPFRKIAEQLSISTKSVIERYKKLRGNVLTLSSITVDLSKLGYAAGAFLIIKLTNKSKMPEVVAELLKVPNLIALVRYIGAYDLFAHVVFEDFQAYFKMTDEIRRIKHVDKIDIYVVPNFPSWPPNFFAFLLDSEITTPKTTIASCRPSPNVMVSSTDQLNHGMKP